MSQYIGAASGYLLPSNFVNGKDTEQEFKKGISNMTTVTAISCGCLFLITILLFKPARKDVDSEGM